MVLLYFHNLLQVPAFSRWSSVVGRRSSVVHQLTTCLRAVRYPVHYKNSTVAVADTLVAQVVHTSESEEDTEATHSALFQWIVKVVGRRRLCWGVGAAAAF